MTLRASFIGLGAMGASMARHLHEKGLLVAVGNRTQQKAYDLAGDLGVDAPSIEGIASMSDVVALCVTADQDVLDNVAALLPHLREGSVVVDHSTVAPATAQRAAQMLAEKGIAFLDAPVSGGVEGARNGKLSVMVGGDAAALEKARPVLEAYAAKVTHMGGVGAGQSTKAVNQVIVAGIAQAVTEGLALGEALGLEAEALLPTLGAGAAGNWFLEKRGATMLRNEFSVGFKLALLHKDLGIVRGVAVDAGTDRSIIEKSLADFAQLMSEGYGDDDISGLIRIKRGERKA
jgi:3-hydroxyisobutyrate dehydrogenase